MNGSATAETAAEATVGFVLVLIGTIFLALLIGEIANVTPLTARFARRS